MLKRILILLLFISSFSFAEVTNTDIKVLVELIKSETRANRDLIIANQKHSDKRFEDMQKYSNKRFDDVNKRFDTLTTFLGLLFTTMIGGFTAIMWYLVKEKKDIKESVQEKVQENIEEKLQLRLEKKADKKLVDSIMKIFEDFAKTNIEIANVLQQHRIRVS